MPDEVTKCYCCHKPLDVWNHCDGCDRTYSPEELNQPWPKAPEPVNPATKKAGKKNG